MPGIVFVVYPGFELLDVSGPISTFSNAKRALAVREEPLGYRIDLVSAAGGLVPSSSGIALETRCISDFPTEAIDTVPVAEAEREPLRRAMKDPVFRTALPTMARAARLFGSICTGAFVLAALGLLD